MTNIDEKIEDLEYQINRIDGHTPPMNVMNRVHGALGIGMGAILYYGGTKCGVPLNIISYAVSAAFVIDGIGSVLTGKLHYVLFRATKVHPKYKLEKILKDREQTPEKYL